MLYKKLMENKRPSIRTQVNHKDNDDFQVNNQGKSIMGKNASSAVTSFLTPVVLSILICEAAERFAYFGFRAILVLYFKNDLEFSESFAVALFAYVASLAYFSPLLVQPLAP